MGCLFSRGVGPGEERTDREAEKGLTCIEDVKLQEILHVPQEMPSIPLEPRGHTAADFFGAWMPVMDMSTDSATGTFNGINTIEPVPDGKDPRDSASTNELPSVLRLS